MYIMALFFFNRHKDTKNVEPFSELKYSTRDYYYAQAPQNCSQVNSAACDYKTKPSSSDQADINNCLCKYKDNVDEYLAKTSTDITTNGKTNDFDEKYNQMVIKNVNLGIGLGLMMIYIYTTNYQ
jgi:hypothetical protein